MKLEDSFALTWGLNTSWEESHSGEKAHSHVGASLAGYQDFQDTVGDAQVANMEPQGTEAMAATQRPCNPC